MLSSVRQGRYYKLRLVLIPMLLQKFGKEYVKTSFSSHQKAMAALHESVDAKKDETDFNDSSSATSEAKAKAKATDKQQARVEVDDNGFKIPQGATRHHQRKLQFTGHQKVMDRVLKRYLNPSDNHVNEVRDAHELTLK